MNKGIIFSIDAAFAVAMIILVSAAIAHQYRAESSKELASENLHVQALSIAVTHLYNGDVLDETVQGDSLNDFGSEDFVECVTVYDLDPNNPIGEQAEPQGKQFCRVIQ